MVVANLLPQRIGQGGGANPSSSGVSHVVDAKFGKLLWRLYRKGPQANGIEQLKDRGIRARAKRERCDCDNDEAQAVANNPQSVADVLAPARRSFLNSYHRRRHAIFRKATLFSGKDKECRRQFGSALDRQGYGAALKPTRYRAARAAAPEPARQDRRSA